ncbi:MAG: bifunctional glutamate N-acetyltransferase/amino-acid acetyltransferase ArgJ [Phycisphaeraceae bacterium]
MPKHSSPSRPAHIPKPSLSVPRGFRFAGVTAGIKPSGKPDLALIVSDRPAAAAGVFTKNRFCGAPVTVTKKHIRSGSARAIIINSGNANVATGDQGLADAKAMAARVAQQLDCRQTDVLVASTGVIGHPLPMDKITAGIDHACSKLLAGSAAAKRAAEGILTTDTRIKTAATSADAINRKLGLTIDSDRFTLAGIVKGSAMVAPNMATMLGFLMTDAAIDPKLLQALLTEAIDQTFNRISVDSDTSTSDMVLILANGASGMDNIRNRASTGYTEFREALISTCNSLCHQMLWDAEGVTRVFQVIIEGAKSTAEADLIGRTIVDSPLVKAAVHGGDANWGRLAMAIGKSGAAIKQEQVSIAIVAPSGPINLLTNGQPNELNAAQRKRIDKLMLKPEITFHISLTRGKASATWRGTDLSAEYVRLNADYTT